MRIRFVYFDLFTGYQPSLHHGIASLSGALKAAGHAVFLSHVTDSRGLNGLGEIISCDDPGGVIALSFTTNQRKYVRLFLNNASLDGRYLIAGGVHCSLAKDSVFNEFPELDGICIGEGECALKALLRKMELKEDYLDTPGFYFNGNKGIVKNRISLAEEIDALDLPDYSIFDYEKIITENGLTFPMMLSRGCPFDCAYCCNHALKDNYVNKENYVRLVSPRRAIEIIKHNLELFPQAEKISFADDTFTLRHQWISDFCGIYRKEVALPFICNARVETVNRHVLCCLKEAGCVSLDYGVETGNESLRNNILQRRHTNDQIIMAFGLTRGMGIPSGSYNMTGIPFETAEMAKETFLLNRRIRPSFGKVFYFYPYPGTRLLELCREYDLLRVDFDRVSGYLEKPSIKEVFMSHKSMEYYFNLLQIYLNMRLMLKMLRLPDGFEKFLWPFVFLFRGFFVKITDPVSKNAWIKGLRRVLRRVLMRRAR